MATRGSPRQGAGLSQATWAVHCCPLTFTLAFPIIQPRIGSATQLVQEFDAAFCAGFLKEVVDVGADGGGGDAEFGGDFGDLKNDLSKK